MLKNDTLKNGTSRIGLYGSAHPGTAALVKKHFNYLRRLSEEGAYSRVALIITLHEKRTKIMCQNFFTGRTVQKIIEVVFFFLP